MEGFVQNAVAIPLAVCAVIVGAIWITLKAIALFKRLFR